MLHSIPYAWSQKTKLGAWADALLFMTMALVCQMTFAGMFGIGAYELLKPTATSENISGAIIIAGIGLLTSFFFPIFVWKDMIRELFQCAWNFDKKNEE